MWSAIIISHSTTMNGMTAPTGMDSSAYLTIAKLTAILRVANGLDRSHKQKFRDFKTTLKDDQLIITVNTTEDITLERGLLVAKAAFFEEVFSVRSRHQAEKVHCKRARSGEERRNKECGSRAMEKKMTGQKIWRRKNFRIPRFIQTGS